MDKAHFVNSRFEPKGTAFEPLARSMASAFGYTAKLAIGKQLAELLRLRVAQLTPCSYCLILHNRAAGEAGIDPVKVAHLASWRESAMFTPQESAALDYAEALTTYDLARFEQSHQRVALLFPGHEVAEIAGVVINMNVWTRWKLAQGSVPTHSEASTDGAKVTIEGAS